MVRLQVSIRTALSLVHILQSFVVTNVGCEQVDSAHAIIAHKPLKAAGNLVVSEYDTWT